MVIFDSDELLHYGILRRSGRYPWGSGGNVAQRSKTFLDVIEQHLAEGMSEGDIATFYSLPNAKLKTQDIRAMRTLSVNALRQSRINWAWRLSEKGWSTQAIADKIGVSEPTVRNLLAPGAADKANKLFATSEAIKKRADEVKYLDVGKGVENHLGVSKQQKQVALAMLREQGYEIKYVPSPQLTTGNQTNRPVLVAPGVTWKEVWDNRNDIKGIVEMSDDHGRTWYGIIPPKSVAPNRVTINYAEDGGADLDGVMYIRPGVKDLSMGGANYAQVRIQVGKEHYLKGMAIYKDDLPDGVDIMFNTNKSKEKAPKLTDVLKPLQRNPETGEIDPDNPFGAMISRQVLDDRGKLKSAVNIVNEEGDWMDWSSTIASQVLSKQPPTLAKQQLNMTMERRLSEYDEIMSLTNPTLKKHLLKQFADTTDAAAVDLDAASLPGQRWHVILPVDTLKDNEIYAPNYNNGEVVALIRYPHGGTFEIPELVVNNKHSDSKRMLGPGTRDAVGINSRVAQHLSGADFDGDTVLVIPQERGKPLSVKRPLKELENFDPIAAYPKYDGMPKLKPDRKQQLMGDVSNLITDMTIKGAPDHEIARAVKHSMVIIDAEKHELNYRQSAVDNGIPALKAKYQGRTNAGAATLISRAGSQEWVDERQPRRAREGGDIDPVTGRKVYTPTGRQRYAKDGTPLYNKDGTPILKKQRSTKLAETDDAHTLSSGQPIEKIYADHSNRLKGLANQARLDYLATPNIKQSPSAKKVYSSEVESLKHSLDLVLRNAPLERQAQTVAKRVIDQKKAANPNMDKEMEKKITFQALETARARMGAKGKDLRIKFSDREWEAIQQGAVSSTMLSELLRYSDMEHVKQLATPQTRLIMSPSKLSRAQGMLASGHTRAEVAAQLGVSLPTLDRALYGEES